MGKQYAEELQRLIERMGGPGTRVWVNWEALTPKYADHVEATMCELGARMVAERAEAQVAIEGYELPRLVPEHGIAVAFDRGRVLVAGTVAA